MIRLADRQPGQPGGSLTEILYIEDNPADLELMREVLSEYPWLRLSAVSDGRAAMSYLRRESGHEGATRPDLILLDLNLPILDGRSVLIELKADPTLRAIPGIVLSSSSLHVDRVGAYQSGASAFVTKPMELDGFRAMVHALLLLGCDDTPPADPGARRA